MFRCCIKNKLTIFLWIRTFSKFIVFLSPSFLDCFWYKLLVLNHKQPPIGFIFPERFWAKSRLSFHTSDVVSGISAWLVVIPANWFAFKMTPSHVLPPNCVPFQSFLFFVTNAQYVFLLQSGWQLPGRSSLPEDLSPLCPLRHLCCFMRYEIPWYSLLCIYSFATLTINKKEAFIKM